MNSLAFLTVHVHCKIMVIFNCSNLVDDSKLHSKVISGVRATWLKKNNISDITPDTCPVHSIFVKWNFGGMNHTFHAF